MMKVGGGRRRWITGSHSTAEIKRLLCLPSSSTYFHQVALLLLLPPLPPPLPLLLLLLLLLGLSGATVVILGAAVAAAETRPTLFSSSFGCFGILLGFLLAFCLGGWGWMEEGGWVDVDHFGGFIVGHFGDGRKHLMGDWIVL